MKIAIPSETDAGLESIRSGHFGHAAYMTVVEFDDDMNIVGVESVKNADHDAVGCGGVIDFVSGIGVDGILTVGMGMPPFTRFTNAGIKVYSDTTEPNVGNVARLFAEGKVALIGPRQRLPPLEAVSACKGHGAFASSLAQPEGSLKSRRLFGLLFCPRRSGSPRAIGKRPNHNAQNR